MKNLLKNHEKEAQAGVAYALLAYVLWGFLPIYWKQLQHVPALEILTHRMVWSLFFLFILLTIQKRLDEIIIVFRTPRNLLLLMGTSILLASNWFVYIYAVNTDRVIETSLGYYSNPLLNVLFGAILLKERLNLWQISAVILATIGVLNFVWSFGSLPWIAILIAFTFSFYGLFRKMIPVKPLVGLLVETAMLAPLAAAFIIHWDLDGTGSFGNDGLTDLLLIGAGVMTSLPLIFFTNAGKRLRFSTLGIIQYITPSISLSLGVFLYHEPFTIVHMITFGFIWFALLVYTFNSLRQPAFPG